MKKSENAYYDRMHRIGKLFTLGAVLVFIAVPLIVCLANGIVPRLDDLLLASGGLIAIFVPLGIAEIFAEVPVMGTSYYLSCITGNILNLKMPAALNALKVAKVEQGTETADAVTGLAVAVASLVTLVFMALGVLLLAPLRPVLESEAVATAAKYVLPALFGCLALSMIGRNVGGGVIIKGRLKAAIIPFIVCLALFFFIIPSFYEIVEGLIMIICIPVLYFISKAMYKKGMITVELPESIEESGDHGAN